ncbi:hypothetical protein [Tetragenococcus halophilus]|uniref:hypothetical protein n=1 Tax=Tetragenococcus halophilus TaxID=51669 RepID=UPI00077C2F50|nr:hypothetical protein [Tetragenococcus halophilus]
MTLKKDYIGSYEEFINKKTKLKPTKIEEIQDIVEIESNETKKYYFLLKKLEDMLEKKRVI